MVTPGKWTSFTPFVAAFTAIFGLLFLCTYLLSNGQLQHITHIIPATNPEHTLELLYWDMWKHLSNFDVTISREIIRGEVFLVNGKPIAYFLPLPAFIRGMLSVFGLGEAPAISMLIGILVFAIFSSLTYFLIFEIVLFQKVISPSIKTAWLIFILLGSPILSLTVRTAMYWEAIVWGAACYMMCIYLSVYVLFKPKKMLFLVFFGMACGIGLFTRPNVAPGLGMLFLLTMLQLFFQSTNRFAQPDVRSEYYNRTQLSLAIAIFLILLSGLGLLNYAKWGNPFEFGSLTKQINFIGTDRGKDYAKYGGFRLDRIPEAISAYFIPSTDNYTAHTPFINLGNHHYFEKFAKNFDYREPTLPLPVIFPVYSLLAAFGVMIFLYKIFLWFKKKNSEVVHLHPAAMAAWIPGLLLLPLTAEAIRYRGELIPMLVFFSIYGITIFLKKTASATDKKLSDRYHLLTIGMLLLLSIYLSIAAVLIEKQYWHGEETHSLVKKFPGIFFNMNSVKKT